MSVDRQSLLTDEADAWEAFVAVLGRVDAARIEESGLTPVGWSVKDVVVHTGGWLGRCADALEAMAARTWDPGAGDTVVRERLAEVNAGHVKLARAMTSDDATAFVRRERERARRALTTLPELTREAWSWFEESGPMHYAKHAHDVTAWLAGETSEPRVGSLLQTEAEHWVGFRGLVDALAPGAVLPEPLGWTVHDVAFHVAMWLEASATDLEANRGWAHDGDPGEIELVDAMNARWLTDGRGLAPDVVRARLGRARARLRAALAALPAPSDEALGWFEANTVEHYEEHLPHLRLAGEPDAGG